MDNEKDSEEYEKTTHHQIVKFILDLSKEMNIQDTHGVTGNELELITLVRNCQFLYDKNLSDFKDVQKKSIAWSAIASVMHSKVHEVQQRWRSLREAYNKYTKELELRKEFEASLEDNSPSVKPWEFYEDMKFIEPYIIHRRISGGHLLDPETTKEEASGICLSEQNTEILKLISCIQARPILYDSKQGNYKSKEDKIQAWNEVAKILGAGTQDCENKWKALRERYGRERKLRAYQSDRKSWVYFNALSFLDVHIKTRRHSTPRPILPKTTEEVKTTTDSTQILKSQLAPTSSNIHSAVILTNVIKDALNPVHCIEINKDDDDVQEHVEYVDASRSSSISPLLNDSKLNLKCGYIDPNLTDNQIDQDEDELFGQTITAELRRIPSGKKKMKIKAEIYKILYENESDN